MEELKLSIFAASCVFLVIGIVSYSFILQEINKAKEQVCKDIKDHQEWLFNQLYSMAPGKVLKPDEVEEVKSQPATVYNPNKDPMQEFTGKKTDYFV